jgi:heme exporter protein D
VAEILAGRYAAYILPAYAITVLVFAGLVVSSLVHARRWRKRAEALRRK